MTLRIEGVPPDDDTVPVASTGLGITGQVIEIANDVIQRYIACIAEHIKSHDIKVKLRVPTRWRTPEITWQRFDTAIKRLKALNEVRSIDLGTINLARVQIARKLGLGSVLNLLISAEN